MTEVVEYCLVVMVSVLFLAGSAATYGAFAAFESGVQFHASSYAISGLASMAVADGSSQETLSLPDSSIWCVAGVMTFSSGTMTASSQVPTPCDFAVAVPSGVHTVKFIEGEAGLTLAVG